MSEWHLDLVAGICDVHVVPAGTRLCRQADLGALFFLIESGEAVLHRVDERGLQRPVGLVRAGDSFGTTSLFLGEPRDATAMATTETHVWTIRRADFQRLLDDYPSLRRELLIPQEILDKLRAPRYPWLGPGELVVYHCLRHWVVFLQTISFSTFTYATFLGLIAWLAMDTALSSYGVVIPATALYLLLLLWHWANWRNDYFAVTNYRITHRERVAFLYESRREAPIDRVQNMNAVSSFLGRLVGYGDLTIETAAAAGTIRFDRIPAPEKMSQAIWDQLARAQATRRAAQRHLIREALANQLGLEAGEPLPLDYLDEAPTPEVRPGRLTRLLMWLAEREIIPRTRIVTEDSVTWRKHWVFLAADVMLPLALSVTLMVLTVLAFFGIPREAIALFPLYPFVSLFGTVIALGWLWWQYSDWENDLYILTNERIIDVEKRPLFFSEQRREASLGVIQNAHLEMPNVLASLFNYGDVIVQTAGAGDFTFHRVANPREVQQEIFERMRAYRLAMEEREAARRRTELAEWFSVYEELNKRQAEQAERPEADQEPREEPEQDPWA